MNNLFSTGLSKKILTRRLLVLTLYAFLLLPQYSCNTTEPPITPPPEPPKTIKLKLLDVSCTEAFISISAGDTVLPVNITLKKDDAAMFSFILTQTNTTVIDTTLQPDINYVYQITALIKGKEENSDTLQVKTLPTTSNNFTWQTFTFGDPTMGSSTLYDVAIINENNIWAVGEIYADTTGLPYNAVHWDGTNWELKRISVNFRGNIITPPLEGIFTFSSNDIWMVGSLPIHGDGNNWTIYDLRTTVDPNLSLSKAWGSSSNDMYFVGRAGSVAHYKNGVWSKIESGTDALMQDIWGYVNQDSYFSKVISVAFTSPNKAKILSLSTNNVMDTLSWPIDRGIGSIWFDKFHLFVVGYGIWKNKNSVWEKISTVPEYFLNTLRGDKINNLFAVGWTVRMVHYNGVEWKEMADIPEEFNFESVAVNENKVVAVGFSSSGGLVGKTVIFISAQIK